MSLTPTQTTVKPDVYARKAIVTRSRRAQLDTRLAAEFAARRVALAAKLDAIVANNEAWKANIMQEIDSIPENPADLFTPEEIGRMDFDEGLDSDPTRHYAKLGDIEMYIVGWKQAMAEAEDTDDYASWQDDVIWMRTGC